MFMLCCRSVGSDDECLSLLLDRFSRSEERRLVRQKAEEVQLDDISYEGFSGLLSGLFQVSEPSQTSAGRY